MGIQRSTPAHAGNTLLSPPVHQSPTVYPRPRGEYSIVSIAAISDSGLPPPTRGIHPSMYSPPSLIGSTPAHAGNTACACASVLPPQVYPRPRGEYTAIAARAVHARGLPPPTRGIRPATRRATHHVGSTPAHAGNTSRRDACICRTAVYPRPRGEYSRATISARCARGLPPPTRGIHSRNSLPTAGSGSTPAHAGNTGSKGWAARLTTVYPRPRGEYWICRVSVDLPSGLPPPTRGIHAFAGARGIYAGSTPAHAGNTFPSAPLPCQRAVYPRPRGEYRFAAFIRATDRGLPPPTRGIRLNPPLHSGDNGSTPAHAGNTHPRGCCRHLYPVYPRPRGEYASDTGRHHKARGLPPPTRGIRPVPS